MQTTRRENRFHLVVLAVLLGLLSACSGTNGSPGQAPSGHGSTHLAKGTIGIDVADLSTALKAQVNLINTALAKVGWSTTVTDAQNNPNIEQTAMQNMISRNVKGIIVMYIDSSQIAPQLNAAKAAGIPVISVAADAAPNLFSAVYSGDPKSQGTATADYLKSRYPAGTQYVVLDLASLYSENVLITSTTPQLAAAGFQDAGTFDVNIADLTNSIKTGVLNLIQAHPNAKFALGCSSICLPVMAPALQQAGYRNVLSIADDDSGDTDTFAFIRQGMPVVGNVQNLDVSMLIAADQLLRHAATGTAIDRGADAGAYHNVLITTSNVPATGTFTGSTTAERQYFDDNALIAHYLAQWRNEYNW